MNASLKQREQMASHACAQLLSQGLEPARLLCPWDFPGEHHYGRFKQSSKITCFRNNPMCFGFLMGLWLTTALKLLSETEKPIWEFCPEWGFHELGSCMNTPLFYFNFAFCILICYEKHQICFAMLHLMSSILNIRYFFFFIIYIRV